MLISTWGILRWERCWPEWIRPRFMEWALVKLRVGGKNRGHVSSLGGIPTALCAHHSCLTSYTLIQWWFYVLSPLLVSLLDTHSVWESLWVMLDGGQWVPFISAFPASSTTFAYGRHPTSVPGWSWVIDRRKIRLGSALFVGSGEQWRQSELRSSVMLLLLLFRSPWLLWAAWLATEGRGRPAPVHVGHAS